MLEHVKVVIGALLDPPLRDQLGEHHGRCSEGIHQRQTLQHPVADDDPLELGEDPLTGDTVQRRSARTRCVQRVLIYVLEAELGREAHKPQRPQRIVLERTD